MAIMINRKCFIHDIKFIKVKYINITIKKDCIEFKNKLE